MKKRTLLKMLAAAALVSTSVVGYAAPSFAQEVTLRMHQFLPPQANVPKHVLQPWADKVEEESDGRIKVELYGAMSLGGTPPQLIDQARDGAVDIVWTLPGYSPGRFPRAEVFELPFMMSNAEAGSKAYWDLFESDMKDEDFKDFKILGAWMHGPGVIHAKGDGVHKLEDMQGLKLRGPTRVINNLLSETGATPIGMPVPAIPEALSKNVIDGTVIPYEVTTALKIPELVETHTEFSGDKALYTAVFVLAMNKAKYDSLPDDLKKVIDNNSGAEFSAFAGRTMQEYDKPGREAAEAADNEIVILDEAEVARWKEVAQPVIDNWIAEMNEKGIDGADLYERAQALIEQYTTQ
ncbi:TRAP transporter substrate-binding protein [Hoeflea sp. CAU 1731]